MNMEEDYASELLTKWAATGHLDRVHDINRLHVAQRLEGAHRRSLGHRGDTNAVATELNNLAREGYIRQDGHQDVRVRQVRRKGRRNTDRGVSASRLARPALDDRGGRKATGGERRA